MCFALVPFDTFSGARLAVFGEIHVRANKGEWCFPLTFESSLSIISHAVDRLSAILTGSARQRFCFDENGLLIFFLL